MPQLTLSKSIEVKGSPGEVFAYLADIRRHLEWGSLQDGIGLVELQVNSNGAIGVGSTFRSVGRENEAVMRDESTITAFAPPNALSFETLSDLAFFRLRYRHRYELQGANGNTQVTYTATTKPVNFAAFLLVPVMRMMAKRSQALIEKGLARFKAAFEHRDMRLE